MVEIATRSQGVGLNIGSIFSINLAFKKIHLHVLKIKFLAQTVIAQTDRSAHRQEDKHD